MLAPGVTAWLREWECWTRFTAFLSVSPCNKSAGQTAICLYTAFHLVTVCFVRVLDTKMDKNEVGVEP